MPVATLGLVTGIAYGLLAVGLVLAYRASRVINLAQAQIGVLGAALLAVEVNRWQLPYWVVLPTALALAAATGACVEFVVMRRLQTAPRLMTVIATLGAGQVLMLAGQSFAGSDYAKFPAPPGLPQFAIGGLQVTTAHSATVLLSPIVVGALALFLKRSRYGLALRAAADNADAARMASIPAGRMRMLAWALAGAVSAFTAIMVLPTQVSTSPAGFGPGLLVRGLAAALVARMHRLSTALVAGIGVGVLEQAVLWNRPQSQGLVDVALFVVVLAAMLLQRQDAARGDRATAWLATRPWAPLSPAQRQHPLLRHLTALTVGCAAIATAAIAVSATNNAALALVAVVGFAVVGLSVGVLCGMAGQVSLGQFAFAGVGAAASAQVATHTANIPLGIAVGALSAAALNVLVGLPALRGNAMMLATTTLAFAVAADTWVLRQPWALGQGLAAGQPVIGGFAFDTGKRYLLWALSLFVLALLLTWNLRRSNVGRAIIAVRDNEAVAQSFGLRTTGVKTTAFAFAGLLAGLGGAIFAHSAAYIDPGTFPSTGGIDAVAMAALGGISLPVGPVLGALYVIGVPRFAPLDSAGLAASSLGWLLLVLYFPAGLVQLIAPVRARIINALVPPLDPDDDADTGSLEPRVEAPHQETPTEAAPSWASATFAQPKGRHTRSAHEDPVALSLRNVTVSYGAVRAVDDVSLDIRHGESVGLIGPNGAGKTTLFEAAAGFASVQGGTVLLYGSDISAHGPAKRSRAGLVRSFQDAALFPTLSVREVLTVPASGRAGLTLTQALTGGGRSRTRANAEAEELIHLFGLHEHADTTVAALSTGTRRLVDLAAMVALRPRVLLLDEPTSGVAQKETEALAQLLTTLRRDLDLTLVLVEHDMQFLSAVTERVVVLERGRVIADGAPAAVMSDARVVSAYLGTDAQTLHRSDLASAPTGPSARPTDLTKASS